jgi:hypothetical protein
MSIEQEIGKMAAEQIQQMQAESASFKPTDDKLQEAQRRMMEALVEGIGKPKNQPQMSPVMASEDFQWILMQLQQNPLVIPYFREKLEATLVQLKADIEASLARTLGRPKES